jgi:hypothetical protein
MTAPNPLSYQLVMDSWRLVAEVLGLGQVRTVEIVAVGGVAMLDAGQDAAQAPTLACGTAVLAP